jgi:hypothetical protein
MIKGVLNGILGGIENTINGAINAINALIQGANQALTALKLPSIPTVPQVSLPRFAEGGVVSGPTLAMVGEGGEPEYIVPQSKASTFAANWMAGVRGPAAIPRFAWRFPRRPLTQKFRRNQNPSLATFGPCYFICLILTSPSFPKPKPDMYCKFSG